MPYMEYQRKKQEKGDLEMKTLFIKDGITYAYINEGGFNLIDQAKRLRHDVYVACGFIEPTKTRTIEDKKDDDCHYLVALDEGSVIGTIRLSKPPFNVFEALDHDGIDIYPEHRDLINLVQSSNTLELGALAVRPKMKTGKSHISGGLYKSVYLFSLENDVKYWLIDVDQFVGDSLRRLGWKLIQFAPEHEYMGSVTVPAIMPVAEQIASIEENNPDYAKFVLNER